MAKRLHMSTADYLAIAASPALIMALVGSLVLFLIEVLYVGEYTARLVYVFALFVFATVLIARLAIEFGNEHASMFAAPFGLLVFFALIRFVEFPNPFSHLINLALMAVIWWWAHKLTVNCTLIDDNDDASGEGLMERIGVDYGEATPANDEKLPSDNELFAEVEKPAGKSVSWWQWLLGLQKQSSPPGLWVIYFSLIALPLFGLGQHFIPPSETGRRRYAFLLLTVYVASGLALLVTTSFLGLRRYLRQRRLEMPAPMAATWVSVGGVVILIVMLLAALIPRPGAEYAISQVPWQVSSPDGLKSSRASVGREGTEDDAATNRVTSEQGKGPLGEESQEGAKGNPIESDKSDQSKSSEGKSSNPNSAEQSSQGKDDEGKSDSSNSQSDPQKQPAGDTSQQQQQQQQQSDSSSSNNTKSQSNEQASKTQPNASPPQHAQTKSISRVQNALSNVSGGLAGILKLVLYAFLAAVVAYLAWRHRAALARAIADLWKQLRNFLAQLFGGRRSENDAEAESAAAAALTRDRPFAAYRNPFASGDDRRMSPEELVRYTFEAFEAWARDGGCRRSPDQTPAELVRSAVPPKAPLFEDARRMLRLYSEAAYASGTVTREAAQSLANLWQLMQSTAPRVAETAGAANS